MLQRYGILTQTMSRSEALAASRSRAATNDDGQTTRTSIWSVPEQPEGFPHDIPNGFALAREESGWLRDRILAAAPGSLLAHLMREQPDAESATPWSDSAARHAPAPAQRLLGLAEHFSNVMHGAQLLYNFLLASDADELGVSKESQAAHYRDRIETWAQELNADAQSFHLDNLLGVLHEAHGTSVPITRRTQEFIVAWARLVGEHDPRTLVDSEAAQELIRRREEIKGAKRRLRNRKRLAEWSGASGSNALTYRWNTVKTIVDDIHDGLQRA